jgi:hypothetical protein
MITDPQEVYRFLSTPGIEVVNLIFARDVACWAFWWFAEDENMIPDLRHTNEVIDLYVTAGVRIHLQRYLDRLKERTLYCDTNLILHIQVNGKHHLIA